MVNLKKVYRITGWELETRNSMGEVTFSGIVYTQEILLSKIRHAKEFVVNMKFFYRDHKPMPHMTFIRVIPA